MNSLTNNELKNIVGGKVSLGFVAGIIASISFLIGLLDGLTRPFPCRK